MSTVFAWSILDFRPQMNADKTKFAYLRLSAFISG
jgi:hypothetical protein